MDPSELGELVRRGEDSRTQLKLTVTNPQSLAGDLVAFSNARGGRLIIGVSDQGEVVGLSSEEIRRLNQLISNAATDLVRPPVSPLNEIESIDGALVMVVAIAEGISKPYSDNQGVFWMKAGADKRRVTSREEIQRMFQGAALVHADEVPIPGTSVADVDVRHLGRLVEARSGEPLESIVASDDAALNRLLTNLGLMRGDSLNLAGLMLLGHRPQRHRPVLVVKAVSFVGDDPATESYRDSEDIDGCLLYLYKGTLSFLTRNLRRVQRDQPVNTLGELEVPVIALEELVVNMLVHRDYFISAPWRVLVFDSRIELISPGALPNNLTIENIKYGVSNIRNPLIASFATSELPYRGIGTGIRRALASVPDLQLSSDHDANQFTATIPRPV